MKRDKKSVNNLLLRQWEKVKQFLLHVHHVLTNKNDMTKAILAFIAGTIGILVAAGPFIDSSTDFF